MGTKSIRRGGAGTGITPHHTPAHTEAGVAVSPQHSKTKKQAKKIVVTAAASHRKNAYQVFLDALSNPNTRTNYVYFFERFRSALRASESCNELLEMEGRELEDRIVEYIKDQVRSGASTASLKITLTAIKKFFTENREESRLNWGWLKGRIPRGNGQVKDRDYQKDELVRMWEESDTRKRAILALLMAGLRKGAIPDLRVSSLAKLTEYKDRSGKFHKLESYHVYKLTVYEGDPNEQYVTFTTPAGAKAIDRYLQARATAGETITAKTYLIRNTFDASTNNDAGGTDPKPITLDALDAMFMRLTRSTGIRPKEQRGKRQDRHDIMLFHGVRKYVNHAMVNAGVDTIAKELLIGHAPPGLEGSYLRLTEAELLSEFVRAIPALSLSQEHELTQQVDELRIEVADLNVLKAAYNELKQEKEQYEGQLAMMQEESRQLADVVREQQQVVREIQAVMKEKLREREEKKKGKKA
jgi:hypothetical protein